MKRSLLLICFLFLLLLSCVKERDKARLLEYDVKGQTYSCEGYAFRYNDYVSNISKGYDWHVYNLGQNSLYIQAYDTTFARTVFNYPSFQAEFNVELSGGATKTYKLSSGQFRIVGIEMGDVVGDFHFTMKNEANKLDSLVITNGYYRIFLDLRDRMFSK